MKVPLTGGFYVAKSIIAGAQRAVNVYAEVNQPDAPFPFTSYERPGLNTLATATSASTQIEVRGLYTATNGNLYAVVNDKVYYVDPGWNFNLLGSIGTSSGQVSMMDNRLVVVLVDGSSTGYTINPTTHAFATIVDAAFYGANRVDYLDTFFTFNVPGTNQWYISPSEWDGVIAFDPLDIATKTGTPDGISTVIVDNRNIWLLGDQMGTEVWYNVGKPDFTFERMPGVIVQRGCQAVYSSARYAETVFWLGGDPSGDRYVLEGVGYEAKVVTPPAVQSAWSSYSVVTDAFAFTVQFENHAFYVITFPTADKTWAYDITESPKAQKHLWYEWLWQDDFGSEHRWRANCHAFAYGYNIVGDWQNGKIYALQASAFTDDAMPIVRRRGFPHTVEDGDRISVRSIIASMQVGAATGTLTVGTDLTDGPSEVTLNVSINGGASWAISRPQSIGSAGQYLTSPQWNQVCYGRDLVFELMWDVPFKTAVQGLFMDAAKAGT